MNNVVFDKSFANLSLVQKRPSSDKLHSTDMLQIMTVVVAIYYSLGLFVRFYGEARLYLNTAKFFWKSTRLKPPSEDAFGYG